MSTEMQPKLHGVYLDEMEPRPTTMEVPHKVFTFGRLTYFACQYRAGDWCIHEHDPSYQQGYGGSMITFLMEDGSFRTVKGPFSKAGIFDHGTLENISKLGIDMTARAYRLTVGKNLGYRAKGQREITVDEPDYILGDWQTRVLPEWRGLELQIHSRGSYRTMTVDEVLKPAPLPREAYVGGNLDE